MGVVDWRKDPMIRKSMYLLIESMGTQEFPEIAPIWFPEIGENWVELWRMLCMAHVSLLENT